MRIFLIILISLSSLALNAKEKNENSKLKGEWNIGVGGGITLSSVDFESYPSTKTKNLTQILGGVSIRYLSEKNLGLIAELNYSQQGWATKFDEENNLLEGMMHEHKLNYLEIPLMTHIYFGNKIRFFVNLGPKISFLLSESETMNTKLKDFLASGNATSGINLGQFYRKVEKKIDYGILAGLGLEFRTGIGNFSIEGRYNFGFGDIYKNSRSDHYSRSANRVISAKVTYYIKAF